ncbi:hypothetical protein EV356DRAFT_533616 [Viridothelium virens]|uniref:Uncharacterized protein n=1 Tax=Viridothelium virens TaxID=1048519 RepID=A0A6A6H7X4_VIRVR|nr:hypothetical protein EV356DRAFT_533616 [Viridothelium virens]
MFIDWAKRPKDSVFYVPGRYSQEPWLSNAASAWILGQQLQAPAFQRYALSQFVQNCAIVTIGPWAEIEEKAPSQSPLRRFSDHWVAWNSWLCGPGINEYTGLKAAKPRLWSKASAASDPRTLDLDHWYERCGALISRQCSHDPIVRQQEEEYKRLHNRSPPLEWGEEWERAANRRRR